MLNNTISPLFPFAVIDQIGFGFLKVVRKSLDCNENLHIEHALEQPTFLAAGPLVSPTAVLDSSLLKESFFFTLQKSKAVFCKRPGKKSLKF